MNKISTYRKHWGYLKGSLRLIWDGYRAVWRTTKQIFAHPDWRSAEKLLPHLTIWDLAVFLMMFSRLM